MHKRGTEGARGRQACLEASVLSALLFVAAIGLLASADRIGLGYVAAVFAFLYLGKAIAARSRKPRTAAPREDDGHRHTKEHAMDEHLLDTDMDMELEGLPSDTALLSRAPLDAKTIFRRLLDADDAIVELRDQMTDIATREALETYGASPVTFGLDESPAPLPPAEKERLARVTPLERFWLRLLQEAGLGDDAEDFPPTTAIRLRRTGRLFLRPLVPFPSRETLGRIVRVEAAITALETVRDALEDGVPFTERDAYRAIERAERTITAQIQTIGDRGPTLGEEVADGEWAVRHGIAAQVECFRLPYRLVCDYRVNMQDGIAIFELDATPPSCFPASAWVDGLGRVVETTRLMRKREAGAYALRVGVLLAAAAFRCTPRMQAVTVYAVQSGDSKRSCLYTATFDRVRFAQIDLDDIGDPIALYERFGATMQPESGMLAPVKQETSLSDIRFCPPFRHELPALSTRRLFGASARALGTKEVRGLAAREADLMAEIAQKIVARLGTTVEAAVQAILETTKDTDDPAVQQAAKHTMDRLIEGELAPDDPWAIEDAFVASSPLSRALERAERLAGTPRADEGQRMVAQALERSQQETPIVDTPDTVHRYFRNYIDRVMWNRLEARPGQQVVLVPDDRYEACLFLAHAALGRQDFERARSYAAQIISFAPLDTQAWQLFAHTQAMLNEEEGAKAALAHLLKHAYDAETLGASYAYLASLFNAADDPTGAAACYRQSLRFPSPAVMVAAKALSELTARYPTQTANIETEEDVRYILLARGIPFAPTTETIEIFSSGMKAAVNAEVFPAARCFVDALSTLTGDDVLFDIARSLEGPPDH